MSIYMGKKVLGEVVANVTTGVVPSYQPKSFTLYERAGEGYKEDGVLLCMSYPAFATVYVFVHENGVEGIVDTRIHSRVYSGEIVNDASDWTHGAYRVAKIALEVFAANGVREASCMNEVLPSWDY